MRIYFEPTTECDFYYFFERKKVPFVILPNDIFLDEFLIFLQGSLDKIRPIILIGDPLVCDEILLSSLKGSHFKIVEHRYIFLNYSIRNFLKNLNKSKKLVKSFDEMSAFLSESLQERQKY